MNAHDQAKWRKRRIILNNDGCDLNQADPASPVTPEVFLADRTSGLADSQVDSIFYCSGVFNLYSHRSEESEFRARDEEKAFRGGETAAWKTLGWAKQLADQGTDSLELVANWCHENGREVFWSMRMNDQHDQSRPWIFSKWKDANREWLMNTNKGWPRGSWSMVDYTIPEVREKVFRILQDVVTRYDVDGVELDFFRHLCFFRAQKEGREVTDEHRGLMTDLIRRVRALTEERSRTRGRPMLISVRVPDDVDYCRGVGLDLGRWLTEKLVDLVATGDYFKLRPWADLVALGRKYEVPVYPCFESRRLLDGGGPEAATVPEVWRGEALRAWDAGVDGIYTFNRFEPADPIFREIGDPEILRTRARKDQESFAGPEGTWYRDPGFWLKGGRAFLKEATK